MLVELFPFIDKPGGVAVTLRSRVEKSYLSQIAVGVGGGAHVVETQAETELNKVLVSGKLFPWIKNKNLTMNYIENFLSNWYIS